LLGKSELWVTAKSCNKTKDLIQKTKEVMGSFNRDTMAKACKRVRSKIKAVITADSSFNK
jgi:hypothetical protein